MPMKRSRVFTSEARIIDRQAKAAVPSSSSATAPTTPCTLQWIEIRAIAITTSSTMACASARIAAPVALPSTIPSRGSGVASRRCNCPTSRSQITPRPKKIATNNAAWAITPGAR